MPRLMRGGRNVICRTRRIKCDEAKPSCKKCVSTGRQCLGYEDIFVSLASKKRTAGQEAVILPRPDSAPSAAENRAWDDTSARLYTASREAVVPEFTLEPFEWDFMQCARYCMLVHLLYSAFGSFSVRNSNKAVHLPVEDLETVHPRAFLNVDRDRIPPMTIKTLRNMNRSRFIIHSAGEYLNRISRAQNTLPRPSALPTTRRLWQKFHYYALDVLRDVNDNIRENDNTPEGNAAVLVRIFSLVNAEVF